MKTWFPLPMMMRLLSGEKAKENKAKFIFGTFKEVGVCARVMSKTWSMFQMSTRSSLPPETNSDPSFENSMDRTTAEWPAKSLLCIECGRPSRSVENPFLPTRRVKPLLWVPSPSSPAAFVLRITFCVESTWTSSGAAPLVCINKIYVSKFELKH